MTLKEKAEEAWNNYEYREGNLYSNCFKDGFIQGVKIADDYAIEFAKWCMSNYNMIKEEHYNIHLERFKKEKGL